MMDTGSYSYDENAEHSVLQSAAYESTRVLPL